MWPDVDGGWPHASLSRTLHKYIMLMTNDPRSDSMITTHKMHGGACSRTPRYYFEGKEAA